MSGVSYENTLPDGSILVQDEKIVTDKNFPVSIATFYINARAVATNKRFIAHFPKVILGLIPLGFEDVNMSLKQISSVTVKVQYYLLRLFFGAILVMAGFGNLSGPDAGAGFFLLLLGVILFGSGISPYLAVAGTGSEVVKVPVVFWKKSEAIKFSRELNTTIIEQN